MFYQGDLQAGIGKAMQESKSVLCFTTDGSAECETWERQWLQTDDLLNSIEEKAVALRLESGSQQAEYLAAFCPIPSIPFLVVIYQGQIEERLTSGITESDFTSRILRALDRSQHTPSPENIVSAGTPQTAPLPRSADSQAEWAEPSAVAASPSPSSPIPQPQPSSPSQTNRDLVADRRARVEAQQRKVAEAQKAERAQVNERARLRREAADSVDPNTPVHPNDRISDPDVIARQAQYAAQEKKRLKGREAERDRILRQLEYDKQERRDRAEQKRLTAEAIIAEQREQNERTDQENTAAVASDDNPPKSTPSGTNPTTRAQTQVKSTKGPTETRISIRLLTGASIRYTASPTSTLSSLRQWLDTHRTDSDHPYTLKHLLAPLPSRSLADADEQTTLHDLGLHPTATLVMSPVQGFAAAYQQPPAAAAQTVGWTLWSYLVGVVMAVVGMVKTFLGIGTAPALATRQEDGVGSGSKTTGVRDAGSESGIRIRTVRDQRGEASKDKEKGKQPLYNGNQLNFESRDDADKDERGSGS